MCIPCSRVALLSGKDGKEPIEASRPHTRRNVLRKCFRRYHLVTPSKLFWSWTTLTTLMLNYFSMGTMSWGTFQTGLPGLRRRGLAAGNPLLGRIVRVNDAASGWHLRLMVAIFSR